LPRELIGLVRSSRNISTSIVGLAILIVSVDQVPHEPLFSDVHIFGVTVLGFGTRSVVLGILKYASSIRFAPEILIGLCSLDRPRKYPLERGKKVAACDGDQISVEDVDCESRED